MNRERYTLDAAAAARFAGLALACVQREFPYQPAHVIAGPDDLYRPRDLHPAFYGCFDWHSAVHGHWLLVHTLRRFPDGAAAANIRAALDGNLTAAHLQAEADYFHQHPSFERPYGWGWLLKLAQALLAWDDDAARRWSAALTPLAERVAGLYVDYFPRQAYPIRSGVHSNTAFGLSFAWDYARAAQDEALAGLVRGRALDYFARDRGCPIDWEPSGHDFLSPCLTEADLMRRVLPEDEFAAWLEAFLPGLGRSSTLEPVLVADRADGQLVHLDGLNLSRAWGLWNVARALPAADPRVAPLAEAAAHHAEAGLAHILSGDYMGEHWLASFAVYALECAAGEAV